MSKPEGPEEGEEEGMKVGKERLGMGQRRV
jgi:hypothetical protein